jgi:hypothetical protein
MKREKIRLIDTDETVIDAELISILEHDNKKYVVYTKGESQKSGNLILYITRLKVKDGEYILENIDNDSEWRRVKSLMSRIINN